MPRVSSALGGFVDRLSAAGHAEIRVPCGEIFDDPIDPLLEVAPRDRRPHRRREHCGRQHLVKRADSRANLACQLEHLGARMHVNGRDADRRSERSERARPVADGVPDHLGEFARKRPLPLLDVLMREDVVLED